VRGTVLILVITSREHRYTHLSPRLEGDLDLDIISYDEILHRKNPHQATHIFTDLDRLPNWALHEAALLFRQLKRDGIRALNDPALFLGRYGLLRGLCRAGINDFNAYRVDSAERPSKWPVFLRLEGNHSAPVSGLVQSEQELEGALRRAIDDGAPRSALLIIEYAAEPEQPGIYRKLSVFRIGDRLLGYTCVHEDNWLVKYGKPGITTPALYDEEYSLVAQNPYGEAMKSAFDLAGIEYGRVDFGLVGGKPQVYEINSNPHVDLNPRRVPNARRGESFSLFRANYIDAMNAIDDAPRPYWQRRSFGAFRKMRDLPRRAIGRLYRWSA
jgi:hypothetical protein